jgi:hypothetical protein
VFFFFFVNLAGVAMVLHSQGGRGGGDKQYKNE